MNTIHCPGCNDATSIQIDLAERVGATNRWHANCVACGQTWDFED
jgi:transcription elongation factor Elf1